MGDSQQSPPAVRVRDVLRLARGNVLGVDQFQLALADVPELRRILELHGVARRHHLIRRGHDVRVDDVGMIRQLGPARAFDGQADGRLFLIEGPNALLDQPGATRVALHVDLDANQQAELRGLRDDLSSYLSTHPITLTPSGRDALANGHIPALAAGDQVRLLEGDQIREMLANGWIDADGQVVADMRRYAELQHRLNLLTVGLFVAPLS